jgi:hypothetical protein
MIIMRDTIITEVSITAINKYHILCMISITDEARGIGSGIKPRSSIISSILVVFVVLVVLVIVDDFVNIFVRCIIRRSLEMCVDHFEESWKGVLDDSLVERSLGINLGAHQIKKEYDIKFVLNEKYFYSIFLLYYIVLYYCIILCCIIVLLYVS